MARRGRGEGTILQRKDGRWMATLTLESKAGKRQRRSLYGKSRAEVAKGLRAAQKRLDDSLPLPPENETIGSFLTAWLKGKKNGLRPETYRSYSDRCPALLDSRTWLGQADKAWNQGPSTGLRKDRGEGIWKHHASLSQRASCGAPGCPSLGLSGSQRIHTHKGTAALHRRDEVSRPGGR